MHKYTVWIHVGALGDLKTSSMEAFYVLFFFSVVFLRLKTGHHSLPLSGRFCNTIFLNFEFWVNYPFKCAVLISSRSSAIDSPPPPVSRLHQGFPLLSTASLLLLYMMMSQCLFSHLSSQLYKCRSNIFCTLRMKSVLIEQVFKQPALTSPHITRWREQAWD